MKEKMIKQYVKDKKGQPIGVMVAVLNEDVVTFGWSLCHKSDQFSKKKGTMIAENRAVSGKATYLPETLSKPMVKFIDRAGRYFEPKPVTESDIYTPLV